jgi:hypothetical protein
VGVRAGLDTEVRGKIISNLCRPVIQPVIIVIIIIIITGEKSYPYLLNQVQALIIPN